MNRGDTTSIELIQGSTLWPLMHSTHSALQPRSVRLPPPIILELQGESQAAPITVVRSAPLRLSPLRLHRLELATIKIDILWANGTRPERSNIYFKNVLYPLHGGTAPQIDDDTGEFTLPKGFDYDAVASVQCDAGEKIESRESKPASGSGLLTVSLPQE